MNNPFLITVVQYLISPAIIVSVILWVFTKVYKFGELTAQFKTALHDIHDLKNDMKDLRTETIRLTNHVDIIKTHLVSTTGMDAGLFSAKSPLSLNPKGKELIGNAGFEKIYKQNKEEFITILDEYNAKTLSDIDDASIKMLDNLRDDPRFSSLKEAAFNNGITYDVLLRACAIYLRDALAKERNLS